MIKIKLNSKINERESDISYGKIVDYFYNILKNPSEFIVDAADYRYNDPETGDQIVPTVRIYSYQPSDWREEYKRYKEFTGDENKIIKTVNHFIRMMKDLNIYILPGKVRPEAGGDMSADGIMRVFLKNWNPPSNDPEDHREKINQIFSNKKPNEEVNYMDNSTNLYNEYTTKTLQKALDGVNAGRFADYIKKVLVHEAAHYINAVRSSGDLPYSNTRKIFRASGGKKGSYDQFNTDKPEYSQSTEEWQARFSEALHVLESVYKINFKNIDADLAEYQQADTERRSQIKDYYKQALKNTGFSAKAFQMVWDLKRGSPTDFINDFADVIGSYDHYMRKMNQKQVNRVMTRIYSIYTDYKKRFEDHPLYKVFEITYFPSW